MIDDRIAYAEVDEILNLLEDKYIEKVPVKIREFLKQEKINDYKPIIDISKSLTEQNLKRETIILLTILNINYWCDSNEEKQEFLNELAKNEKEKQELEKKYNPDNLFKNNKIENEEKEYKENKDLVEYKKNNIFKKLLNKIMNFFKK